MGSGTDPSLDSRFSYILKFFFFFFYFCNLLDMRRTGLRDDAKSGIVTVKLPTNWQPHYILALYTPTQLLLLSLSLLSFHIPSGFLGFLVRAFECCTCRSEWTWANESERENKSLINSPTHHHHPLSTRNRK